MLSKRLNITVSENKGTGLRERFPERSQLLRIFVDDKAAGKALSGCTEAKLLLAKTLEP